MARPASSFTLPAPGAPLIEVRGLWSLFPAPGGKQTVVHRDLDLTVLRGEVLTLAGGSGTGKTVLLRQILGLATPARGTVTVLGRPAAQLSREGAAARVGMLFQQGALFSAFTVLENIALPLAEAGALPPDLIREAALLKLRMVGLKPGDAHKMPAELSGGMIKRAALARALIMDPPLLMLDEPTAGLDPDSSDAFCELLTGLRQELKFTVVMVTHDLDTLFALSTRVAVLAQQHVIIAAPVPDVLTFDHPFIQQFFGGERGQRALARQRLKR
ncbi:MAG: ATP-binding cassette domain-containing protein [Burkholderiaceae bacterium]|jgi:phospholipid/cholesterol/gamma-HCH transport system ATP-binding protein|nr:ATP-binding cassette domain-containing protein [Burkholderiaceae bacterium]